MPKYGVGHVVEGSASSFLSENPFHSQKDAGVSLIEPQIVVKRNHQGKTVKEHKFKLY